MEISIKFFPRPPPQWVLIIIIMVIIITIMITMVNMSYLTDVSDEVALKGEPDKGDVALFL